MSSGMFPEENTAVRRRYCDYWEYTEIQFHFFDSASFVCVCVVKNVQSHLKLFQGR